MDSPPARPPRRLSLPLADGAMSALEFGDRERPVDVLWAHANGFNAPTYRQALAPLGADLRVVAVDLRGHGLTDALADPDRLTSWRVHARDLAQAMAALGGPPLVLAGHSMGATAALLAGAAEPERVRGLVLFEPVILARPVVWAARLPWGRALLRRRLPWATAAARRRAVFPSAAAAVEALRGRGVFKGWDDAVLADYVDGGVRPTPDGEVTLACAPAWEAANYAAQRHDPYAALRRLREPLRIFKAERDSTCSLTAQDRAVALRREIELTVVPGSNHFLPVARPDLVRAALRAAVA